jgi:tripartite-type tricarboxylate transporter receptor subunit TctC
MKPRRNLKGITMRRLAIIFAAAVIGSLSSMLRADDYPTRPITLIAVFGPGSASDTICRIIADKLSPILGQPIVVEDRPGADGALAALYVHHQPADGYTLLMGTNSPLSADPFIHKDINYDPIKDFVPITRVGSFTLMLVVNPTAADSFGQGIARLCQGQPRQADLRQWQHRRDRRHGDHQEVGGDQHPPRPL